MLLVALTGVPLSRSVDHLPPVTRDIAAGPKTMACRSQHRRRSTHLTLNRERHRPLSNLLQGYAAAARRKKTACALVDAVSAGLIDVIMSDHNPQDVETKRLPFAEAAPGAIGLETMLTAGLRLVNNHGMPLTTLLGAMSSKPAELLGLPGGTLRNGAPADVIVIDPDTSWVLDPSDLKSKCKNTPFDEARAGGPRGAHHRCRTHRL